MQIGAGISRVSVVTFAQGRGAAALPGTKVLDGSGIP